MCSFSEADEFILSSDVMRVRFLWCEVGGDIRADYLAFSSAGFTWLSPVSSTVCVGLLFHLSHLIVSILLAYCFRLSELALHSACLLLFCLSDLSFISLLVCCSVRLSWLSSVLFSCFVCHSWLSSFCLSLVPSVSTDFHQFAWLLFRLS